MASQTEKEWDAQRGQWRWYDYNLEQWIFQDPDPDPAHSSIARNRSDSGHGYGLSEIDTISQRLAGQSLNEGANRVLADDDVLEVRNKRFKRVGSHRFQPGFVFQCIFNQEAGPDNGTQIVDQPTNRYGQRIYSEVRMFVVMRNNGDYSSTCLSVQTFQDQGVAKVGAIKSNYAILYSGRVPSPGRGEEPGRREEGMRDPIEVTLESRVNGINPMSRIHLRALHCCQQNWRIFPIGWIAEDSWETLWNNHFLVTDDGYTDGIPPLGGDQEQTRRPRRGRRSNPNASSQ